MSARSATEIVERMKELSQNLGSAFGRLISEAVLPIVTRTLSVMDDKGLIALPLKINGLEVSVQPTSPLAMAASNEEVQTAMSFIQLAGQLGPSGQMAVNIDRAADYIADKLGVPTELRTTPQEREAMAAQMMQAQMMQAQAAQGQAQGPAPDTPPEEMMPNEQ